MRKKPLIRHFAYAASAASILSVRVVEGVIHRCQDDVPRENDHVRTPPPAGHPLVAVSVLATVITSTREHWSLTVMAAALPLETQMPSANAMGVRIVRLRRYIFPSLCELAFAPMGRRNEHTWLRVTRAATHPSTSEKRRSGGLCSTGNHANRPSDGLMLRMSGFARNRLFSLDCSGPEQKPN